MISPFISPQQMKIQNCQLKRQNFEKIFGGGEKVPMRLPPLTDF